MQAGVIGNGRGVGLCAFVAGDAYEQARAGSAHALNVVLRSQVFFRCAACFYGHALTEGNPLLIAEPVIFPGLQGITTERLLLLQGIVSPAFFGMRIS